MEHTTYVCLLITNMLGNSLRPFKASNTNAEMASLVDGPELAETKGGSGHEPQPGPL